MKFVNSQNCNNDSNCDTLSIANQSLIILQRFTRTDEKSFLGLEKATQTKTVVLSHEFQIIISVNVEIDISSWKILATKEKRSEWLKLRSHLYWGCQTSEHTPSLCAVSRPLATSILTISISKSSSTRSLALCSICFLTEAGIEVLHWPRVSQNLKTFAFNVHHFLPQFATTEQASLIINVSRTDLLPLQDDLQKVFVTNIALGNSKKDMSGPGDKCKFLCGLGPQCLERVSDICDGRQHCVDGEDEDARLCNAIKRGIIGLETNSLPSTTTDMFHYKGQDSRVMPTIDSYMFVMISVIILIILLILFVCFIYRSRQIQSDTINKNDPQKMKITSTSTSQHTDTSCSTCEMRSRLNLIKSNQSGRGMRQLDDLACNLPSTPLPLRESENPYFNHPKYFQSLGHKSNQRGPRANHRARKYSKRKEAMESADWLNLFFQVSCEAQHKRLATQPPPNVSNNRSSHRAEVLGLDLSTTTSTCVFPVMI